MMHFMTETRTEVVGEEPSRMIDANRRSLGAPFQTMAENACHASGTRERSVVVVYLLVVVLDVRAHEVRGRALLLHAEDVLRVKQGHHIARANMIEETSLEAVPVRHRFPSWSNMTQDGLPFK